MLSQVFHYPFPPSFLSNMSSSSIRFTKAEFWLNGVKYLHQDGVAYTILDVAKKAPNGVSWSIDMWKSRKAPAAVQKAFSAAWSAAPVCESCGTKNTSGSICDYCRCAAVCDKLRAARTAMESQEPAPVASTNIWAACITVAGIDY